jgi:O-antigen ligase
MIRTTLLWTFVTVVSVYAWRDWYKAVCGLIVMMAVIQHPDMPKSLFGIQGLNPWNIALASTMCAWWQARRGEGLVWDMPRKVTVLVILYVAVMFVAFGRMIVDRELLQDSMGYLIGDHAINVFKWVVPALMLFDGCRSRERFNLAVFSVLAVYFLLAVQVIKWMPLEQAMDGESLAARSHKILRNEIGYHRVNMSMMLAGASWAVFVSRILTMRRWVGMSLIAASLAVLLAQSLTAGRAGYVTWGVIGLVLCLVRWKRYLIVAPLLVAGVITFVPGVAQRMTQGFSEETRDTNRRVEAEMTQERNLADDGTEADLYTITSGRVFAWPFVIEKIKEAPAFGYGKEAMIRTGLTAFLMEEFGEGFPHPHNAYLELLLDNGVVGFVIVVPFYLLVVYYSLSLFRDSRSLVFVAVGGIAAALVVALLTAGMGSQSFYPREGSVGMWAAIGLMLRVWVQRRRAESMPRAKLMPKAELMPKNEYGLSDSLAPRHHNRSSVSPARPTAVLRQASTLRRAVKTVDMDSYLWRTAA